MVRCYGMRSAGECVCVCVSRAQMLRGPANVYTRAMCNMRGAAIRGIVRHRTYAYARIVWVTQKACQPRGRARTRTCPSVPYIPLQGCAHSLAGGWRSAVGVPHPCVCVSHVYQNVKVLTLSLCLCVCIVLGSVYTRAESQWPWSDMFRTARNGIFAGFWRLAAARYHSFDTHTRKEIDL